MEEFDGIARWILDNNLFTANTRHDVIAEPDPGVAKSFELPAMFELLTNAMEALVSSYSEKELGVLADFFARVGVLWKQEREGLQKRYAERPQRGRRLSR